MLQVYGHLMLQLPRAYFVFAADLQEDYFASLELNIEMYPEDCSSREKPPSWKNCHWCRKLIYAHRTKDFCLCELVALKEPNSLCSKSSAGTL
jgi:hypothetical protein